MKFEWFLALRYFRGKRKGSRFLSFIKIMSITGVVIGSAGLLIALSIVHGFKSAIHDKVLGFGPHIRIASYSDEPLYRADTLVKHLDKYDGIEQVQTVVSGEVMLQSGDQVAGTHMKGVDKTGGITQLKSYINQGEYDLASDTTAHPRIIMGSVMARNLSLEIGDQLIAYTLEGIPSPLNSPEIQQFRLSGIYHTGIDRFDESMALVYRPYARQLFNLKGVQASAIEIQSGDINNIKKLDEQIYSSLSFPYYSETIYERYRNIFAWVDLQEETIPFVISVMIIVAAFNLIGTVLMMVLERTRDIGILKTMGATGKHIRRIFMLEGLFVAGVGLTIGIGTSLLFNWLQSTYHLIPLTEQNYYLSYAPVEPHGIDFLLVGSVTFLLCGLASYLPSRIAARMDPLRVISYGR